MHETVDNDLQKMYKQAMSWKFNLVNTSQSYFFSTSISKISHSLCKPNPKPLNLFPLSTSSGQFLPDPQKSSKSSALQSIFPTNPQENSSSNELPAICFRNLLHLSARYGYIELAMAVHASILKIEQETRLCNVLISAYLKLGRLDYAQKVFESLICPDVVSYTALISGFAKSNREDEAIELFFEMRGSGIEPNEYSFVALLTAASRILSLELGFQVHALMIKMGYLESIHVVNSILGLYSKCGCSNLLIELFDEMTHRDIASWNTLISCMVKESMYERGFESFRYMLSIDGFSVDHFTLSTLLTASTACFAVMVGRELHAHALKIGFESNLSVNNALLGFYTKCGNKSNVLALFEKMPLKDVFTWTEMITAYMEFGLVDLAEEIFDQMPEKNCVSYNALMAGYCRNYEGPRALDLFCQMVDEGMELSDFTLTSAINACGLLMEAKTSKQIHGFVLKFGLEANDCIETALLDMCTRCGRLVDAEKMFNQWPLNQNSSMVWTSMICGYARNGQTYEALSLFCVGWSGETIIIDEIALATVLGVCGTLGFRAIGEQFHCYALKYGYFSDTGVGNAIISMYSKCGNMKDAINVFSSLQTHDIISWNCLIAGHVLHRHGDEALALWAEIEKTGVRPDSFTCLLIISTYRYTSCNLVEQCHSFFQSMETTYHVKPTPKHFASLVGVYGHWGLLREAEEIIHKMPLEPNASVWRALLDSCTIHLNTSIGKRAAKEILALEPQEPSSYILKSNLYSASGRWHCSEMVRQEMREKGFQKIPGRSWIINCNKVHQFYARDKDHPQVRDIYSGLEILILECLKVGYVPDTSFVLHEAEEHQKKNFLFYHSAKLAVTYGLLMTKPGKPIQIMKNIRLCGDCHRFFKYASVVTKREIHVRDASGFHYFLNGQCSWKDHL